jgi:hypothetical protein
MGHDHVEALVRKRQAVEDVTYMQLALVDSIATDTSFMPRYHSEPLHLNNLASVNHRLGQFVGCPDPKTTGVNIQVPHTPSVTTKSVSSGSNAPETPGSPDLEQLSDGRELGHDALLPLRHLLGLLLIAPQQTPRQPQKN